MKDDKSKKENTDDVTIEVDDTLDDSVVAEESAQETIKKLREKLKTAVSEKQQYLDGWQRTKADYANLKKESEHSRKELVKFATAGFVEELLPILESFEMAFGNKVAWEKVDKNWRMGVEHIYNQLINTLIANGLSEDNPVGQKFDPALHEALEFVEVTDPKQDHMILSVVSKGYTLGGKPIKVPKVKVGELKK
jgi:molecular chaperone GrpE